MLQPPPRMHLREFAFQMPELTEDGRPVMVRHRSFKDVPALEGWIARNKPASVYASISTYWNPTCKEMEGKRLIYTDLSFDIDYDHMEAVVLREILEDREMPYEEAIEKARISASSLEDLVVNELGFPRKDLTRTFSGGRGFHLHCRNEDTYRLDHRMLKEITNYVRARGIEIDVTVTQDPHRVIRVPGSMHPRTGFLCQIIESFDSFKLPGVPLG